MSGLVGRAGDCERLDALLRDAAEGRGGALALVGEPGIGKSALLRVRARADGTACCPRPAQKPRPTSRSPPCCRCYGRFFPPASCRRCKPERLRVRSRRPAGAGRSARRACRDARATVRGGRGQPVLTVIDDAHWVDDASADALLFAARRLEGEPIALLLALRPVEGRRLDLAGVEQLAVGGLASAEAAELLRGLPPEVVERLHAATAGNPLALLEAPAHLPGAQLSGRDPLGDPLPVGPGVQAGFRRRLEQLPPSTRMATLLVAAAGAEPLAGIAAAGVELGVSLDDLAPAEADHLVELAPDHVTFRHPLVRAAAYQDAPAPDRRAVHRALAAHTTGARRASHLWAAADGSDSVAATALEAAAGEARGRAGFAAAALAMERAARLTAPGDERAARLFGAAQDRLMGGDARVRSRSPARRCPRREPALLRAESTRCSARSTCWPARLTRASGTCSAAAEAIADEEPERAALMLATAASRASWPVGSRSRTRRRGARMRLAQRAAGVTELDHGILLAARGSVAAATRATASGRCSTAGRRRSTSGSSSRAPHI